MNRQNRGMRSVTETSAWTVGGITVAPGIALRVITSPAVGPRSRGTMVIATGRAEFCEKYADCAATSRSLHFDTVMFDCRGQGLSSRALANRHKGHDVSFEDHIGDLEKIVAHARDLYGGGPVYILAHSMGAHIALRAMARRPEMFRAAILSAPMIDIARGRAQSRLFGGVASVAVRCGLREAYVVGKGGYGARDRVFAGNVLTHDPVRFALHHDAIAANPDLALGGPTWGWLRAALTSIRRLKAEAATGRITTDILIVAAGDDRVVSNRALAEILPDLPNARLVGIPGAYHEILRETPPIRAVFWKHAMAFLARTARRAR